MKVEQFNNVVYVTTKDDKFKTSRVSIKLALPISKDIIANALVLNDLMITSSAKHNTIKSFNEKLYDLYDLSVSSSVGQKGGLHISELNFSFICSEYLSENIDQDVASFIKEVIFGPNFNSDYISNIIEKRILDVKTIYDDKMHYSIKSMQEILDKDGEYLIDVNSTIEDLEKVNAKTLEEFYKQLLTTSDISIFVDGKNSEEIKSLLVQSLDFNNSGEKTPFLKKFKDSNNYKFKCEHQDLNQSKFVVGIKLDLDKDDFVAFQVFNAIYGAYPFSRLFSNIREKQSLAYTVASAAVPSSGLMFIYGGISNGESSLSDEKHMDTILNALNFELDSIKDGKIEDLELAQAKSMMMNSLRSALDSQSAHQSLYYQNYLLEEEFNEEEYKSKLYAISKDDVVKMASKVEFDTVFLLRGDK